MGIASIINGFKECNLAPIQKEKDQKKGKKEKRMSH